jgi:hypothetical protein
MEPEQNGQGGVKASALSRRTIVTLLIVAGMLATGTSNTILTKLQNKQCVQNCDGTDKKFFEQPIWQVLIMFIGESLCMLVYLGNNVFKKNTITEGNVDRISNVPEKQPLMDDDSDSFPDMDRDIPVVIVEKEKKNLTGWANFLLVLPAICDITGTSLMMVGLLGVPASIYQMLRGAVVVFTGFLSMLILKTRLPGVKIYALFTVLFGVAIVGSTAILFKDDSEPDEQTGSINSVLGVILILAAQVFSSFQFIIEEKIVTNYHAKPEKLVGLEGIFGSLLTIIIMIVLHFAFGKNAEGVSTMFDSEIGLKQLLASPVLLWTTVGCALSIAAFNFFGLNITRYISATSRTTIDTCRTLFIWLISVGLGWEKFEYLQGNFARV